MAVSEFNDGEILTGGSLTTDLNQRVSVIDFDITRRIGAAGSLSEANRQTLFTHFISSGTLPPSNDVGFLGDCVGLSTNPATVRNNFFSVALGPSGTSPTLVTVGSIPMSYMDDGGAGTSVTHGFLMATGSTTVDASATPAMLIVENWGPHTNGSVDLRGSIIFGHDRL